MTGPAYAQNPPRARLKRDQRARDWDSDYLLDSGGPLSVFDNLTGRFVPAPDPLELPLEPPLVPADEFNKSLPRARR